MKLAVFSDMHGNIAAFEAALADYEAQGGADRLWFLGDLAAFGPRPAECIRRVKGFLDAAEADEAKKGTVRAIRGNTDRYLAMGARPKLQPLEKLEQFAPLVDEVEALNSGLMWGLKQLAWEDYQLLTHLWGECDLNAEGYGYIIGYHGVPGDDEGYLKPETPDNEALDFLLDREGRMGIGGHIHVQMDRVLMQDGHPSWRVINVGSVGMSKDKPGFAEWGLFTFEDGEAMVDLRAVSYDLEAVMADLHSVGHPAAAWAETKFRPTK